MIDDNKQIKMGSILSYTQTIVSIVIGVLYTPILLKLLGSSEYGLYQTVVSTIAIVSILNLGFINGYIRYYTEYKKQNREDKIGMLNGLYLLFFIILGFVALICGLILSFNLDFVFSDGLTSSEYATGKWLMLLLSMNLAISFPAGVFTSYITANERFIYLKLLAIVKTIISPVITLALLLLGYKSIAMALVTVLVNIVTDLLYAVYCFKKLNMIIIFKNFEKGLLRKIFVYTSFIAIHIVVDQVNTNMGKVLLGRFMGTTAVSIYAIGMQIYLYFVTIGIALSSLFIPKVHTIVEKNYSDKTNLKKELTCIFTKVGSIQFVIVMLVASGFMFFGKQFIYYWAGEGYNEAYIVAVLLMLCGTTDLIQNIGIEIQRAQNLHKFRAISYMIMASINVILSIVYINIIGVIGAAIGTAFSFIIVQGIIMNIYYQKCCNLNIATFWKSIGRISIGLIIPFILGVTLNILIPNPTVLELITQIAFYTFVYLVSIFMLGFEKKDRQLIKAMLKK